MFFQLPKIAKNIKYVFYIYLFFNFYEFIYNKYISQSANELHYMALER